MPKLFHQYILLTSLLEYIWNMTISPHPQVAVVVKNLPASAGGIETWVRSLGEEDPLEESMAVHSSIIA